MNRFEFAKKYSDKEKLAYFEKKSKECKDFAQSHRYAVYAQNLRQRMERDKRRAELENKRNYEKKHWFDGLDD